MAEILIASAVMVMILAAVGTLTMAIQQNADYSFATTTVHQHGRVIIERISAAVAGAASSPTEPPLAVLETTSSTYTFPDTLVVWRGDANNDDVPQVSELVVFCPNSSNPAQLWELTEPANSAVATLANATTLAARVDAMKASAGAVKSSLTEMLRSLYSADLGVARAGIRFRAEMRPTAAEWSQWQAQTLAWNQLSWAQGIYGANTGLRQARVSVEVQLVAEENSRTGRDEQAIPFLGSAANYYEQPK